MRRHAQQEWNVPETADGRVKNWDLVQLAVLMDIRDLLRDLNQTLGCYRVQRMCDDIHRIDRRLQKHLPLPKGRSK